MISVNVENFRFTTEEVTAAGGTDKQVDSSGNCYSYAKGGSTYFKNIEIKTKGGVSLCDKFEAPYFDDNNTLVINLKKGKELPKNTNIFVNVSNKVKAGDLYIDGNNLSGFASNTFATSYISENQVPYFTEVGLYGNGAYRGISSLNKQFKTKVENETANTDYSNNRFNEKIYFLVRAYDDEKIEKLIVKETYVYDYANDTEVASPVTITKEYDWAPDTDGNFLFEHSVKDNKTGVYKIIVSLRDNEEAVSEDNYEFVCLNMDTITPELSYFTNIPAMEDLEELFADNILNNVKKIRFAFKGDSKFNPFSNKSLTEKYPGFKIKTSDVTAGITYKVGSLPSGTGTKINDIYGLVKLSSIQDDTVILYAVWKSKKALDTIKNAEIFAVPAGIKLSWLNPSDESFEKVIISYDGKTKEVYATSGSETTIILDGFEYLHGYVFELRASYANGECSNYRRLKTSYVVHPLDSIGDKIRIKLPDMMCYRSDYQSCVNECNQMKTTSKFSVNIKTKKDFSKVYDVEGNSYDSESNLTVYKSTDGINWEVQASDRTDKDIWFWFPDAVQSQSLFYYIASDTVISSIMRVEVGTPVTEKMGGYVYSDFTVSKEKELGKTEIGRVIDVDYDGNAIAMVYTKAHIGSRWSINRDIINFNTTPVRLSIDDGSYSWEDINENCIQDDISFNGFYYAVHCTDYGLKWHTPALNEFLKFQTVYFHCFDESNFDFMYNSNSKDHFITLAFCSAKILNNNQYVVYGVNPWTYFFSFTEEPMTGQATYQKQNKYVLPFANFHENVQKNLH